MAVGLLLPCSLIMIVSLEMIFTKLVETFNRYVFGSKTPSTNEYSNVSPLNIFENFGLSPRPTGISSSTLSTKTRTKQLQRELKREIKELRRAEIEKNRKFIKERHTRIKSLREEYLRLKQQKPQPYHRIFDAGRIQTILTIFTCSASYVHGVAAKLFAPSTSETSHNTFVDLLNHTVSDSPDTSSNANVPEESEW